jgi:glycosyltransferase involved in cell wall biosynthesis
MRLDTKVTIIRLKDPLYDARIQRIVRTLAGQGYQVDVIYLPSRNSNGRLDIAGIKFHAIQLVSRKLPQWKLGQAIKYMEFILRATVAGWRSKAHVYSAGTTDALVPAYIASKLARARLIYEAQELYAETDYTPFPRFWAWIERTLLPKASGITAANAERAQVMNEEYNSPALPVVISNCPPVYDPRNVQRIQWSMHNDQKVWESGAKVVLYQGSIAHGRGLLSLISAMAHLPQYVYLALVGPQDAEFVEQARQLAVEVGAQDRIVWIDAVPREQLDTFTVSADVGVVFYEPTCRNNYLCAPNKLYDYMMAGLPVVASDLPEPKRVLLETGAGLAVDSSKPADIAEAIGYVLADAKRWEAMSTAGRQAAIDIYSWEQQAVKLLGVYRSVLGQPTQRQPSPS